MTNIWLLNLLSHMCSYRPVIIKRDHARVMDEVQELMQRMDSCLPEREHSILIHVMQHIVDQQYEWGVNHLMLNERVNLFVKQSAHSRRFVEASVAKQLTKSHSERAHSIAMAVTNQGKGTS